MNVLKKIFNIDPGKTILSVFGLVSSIVLVAGIFAASQLSQKDLDIRSDAAETATVSLTFSPVETTIMRGNTLQKTALHANTNGLYVTAAVLGVTYNPAIVQITKIEADTALAVTIQAASIDNLAGKAKITVGAETGQNMAFIGQGPLAVITYSTAANATTDTTISYDAAITQVAGFSRNTAGEDTIYDGNLSKIDGNFVINNPSPTPIGMPITPLSTPTPSVLPIAPLLPTTIPSSTPAITPTPMIATLQLNPTFKLQGLTKADITIDQVEITLKYTTGNTTHVKTFLSNFRSDSTGRLIPYKPIMLFELPGHTTGQALSSVEVYAKTPTSLRKLIGVMDISPTQVSTLNSDIVLPVGDFKRDGAEYNKIKLIDISTALTQYKQLQNPVNDANRAYDVDFNNVFNLQDISTVLSNYNRLVYSGDEL